jgi:hemolysin activation/secretion protein
LGGVPTVRGFDYGTRRGQSFWAAQADWPLTKGLIRPVPFIDVGQAGAADELFSTSVLSGAGLGFSIAGGLLRFDFSYPITDGGDGLRFDIRTGFGW